MSHERDVARAYLGDLLGYGMYPANWCKAETDRVDRILYTVEAIMRSDEVMQRAIADYFARKEKQVNLS